MRLCVISPEKICFDGEAEMISVNGQAGSLSVMDSHIPLVTPVREGDVRIYLADGGVINARSGGGLLSVTKEKTTFLAEGFEETQDAV